MATLKTYEIIALAIRFLVALLLTICAILTGAGPGATCTSYGYEDLNPCDALSTRSFSIGYWELLAKNFNTTFSHLWGQYYSFVAQLITLGIMVVLIVWRISRFTLLVSDMQKVRFQSTVLPLQVDRSPWTQKSIELGRYRVGQAKNLGGQVCLSTYGGYRLVGVSTYRGSTEILPLAFATLNVFICACLEAAFGEIYAFDSNRVVKLSVRGWQVAAVLLFVALLLLIFDMVAAMWNVGKAARNRQSSTTGNRSIAFVAGQQSIHVTQFDAVVPLNNRQLERQERGAWPSHSEVPPYVNSAIPWTQWHAIGTPPPSYDHVIR